jgi:septal ring factor EnvC (AmiA/AmiB activator)
MTRQITLLEEKHSQERAELSQRCTDLEEKYSQGQIELSQVSAALDDANALSSSLHVQLDSEKVRYETVLLFCYTPIVCLVF